MTLTVLLLIVASTFFSVAITVNAMCFLKKETDPAIESMASMAGMVLLEQKE